MYGYKICNLVKDMLLKFTFDKSSDDLWKESIVFDAKRNFDFIVQNNDYISESYIDSVIEFIKDNYEFFHKNDFSTTELKRRLDKREKRHKRRIKVFDLYLNKYFDNDCFNIIFEYLYNYEQKNLIDEIYIEFLKTSLNIKYIFSNSKNIRIYMLLLSCTKKNLNYILIEFQKLSFKNKRNIINFLTNDEIIEYFLIPDTIQEKVIDDLEQKFSMSNKGKLDTRTRYHILIDALNKYDSPYNLFKWNH